MEENKWQPFLWTGQMTSTALDAESFERKMSFSSSLSPPPSSPISGSNTIRSTRHREMIASGLRTPRTQKQLELHHFKNASSLSFCNVVFPLGGCNAHSSSMLSQSTQKAISCSGKRRDGKQNNGEDIKVEKHQKHMLSIFTIAQAKQGLEQ